MQKIEAFYFDDGEDSGEEQFNRFAEKHSHLFDEECDAKESENKLEYFSVYIRRYTSVYREFQEVFEKKIESSWV